MVILTFKHKYMIFYNNIFASTYRYYTFSKGDNASRARFGAAIMVEMQLICLFFFLVAFIRNIFQIHATSSWANYKIIFYILCLVLFRYILKYYSESKTKSIIQNFESFPIGRRRLWGFITISTIILEVALGAFLIRAK